MRAPRCLVRLSLVLVSVVGVANCSQAGSDGSALPMSPSAVSVGESATAIKAGIQPLTDVWLFRLAVELPSERFVDTFQAVVIEDDQGNARFADEYGNIVTLTRKSVKNDVVVFDVGFIGTPDPGECIPSITGELRWRIGGDTIVGQDLRGVEESCDEVRIRMWTGWRQD